MGRRVPLTRIKVNPGLWKQRACVISDAKPSRPVVHSPVDGCPVSSVAPTPGYVRIVRYRPSPAVRVVEIFLAVIPVGAAAISAAVASLVADSFPFTSGMTPAATVRRLTGEVTCQTSGRAVARDPMEHGIGEGDQSVRHPLPCTRVLGPRIFVHVATPPLVHGARPRSALTRIFRQ